MSNNTIAAIATPYGTGGIGIVRLSGDDSIDVAEKLFEPADKSRRLKMLSGYSGAYGRVFDKNGDIDEAVVFVYKAPKSYTGENVVEINCHGGVYVVSRVLRACLDCGASPAQPGEFTKRAFLNGKLNLTQAEAVMDIISAMGLQSSKAALSARDGVLSKKIDSIAGRLVALSSHLAAWIDYPEEDVEELESTALKQGLIEIIGDLNALLATYDNGRMLREGIDTVIAGRPNVGKSTLMNLLSGYNRSIVTNIAGTTRDIIEETVKLDDIVLRLADTAGLRETDDRVESIGVELASKRLAAASLVLAVFDSSDILNGRDIRLIDEIADRPCVAVINKADLPRQIDIDYIKSKINNVVEISANDADSIRPLSEAIKQAVKISNIDASAPIIANERQRSCAAAAAAALNDAVEALSNSATLDAVNVCIDYALDYLFSLTGQKASEAVIDEVFSRFCVGK